MGYTTNETDLLIGLGCSAISDAKYAYAQNLKKVEEYTQAIANSSLAVNKGHRQTDQDLHLKKCILEIACQGKISKENIMQANEPSILQALRTFCYEGILESENGGFRVTDFGRAFIRNICSAFDLRLRAQAEASRNLFSKAI
jgi:oxygen-independent coproporphyrinogen-3 oxidase